MTAPITVLLVDDDVTQLKLSAVRLHNAGFVVELAHGGEEALVKARARKPDVILSDVLMDDLDGFGLCRQLRTDPAFADVPIILLSAHYQAQPDQTLARHVGASALVARTADFDAELAALREYFAAPPPPLQPTDVAVYEEHLRSNAHQLARMLERARSAEVQYKVLFDGASDPITILTPDGFIVRANERWRALIGIDPAAMVGRHIREFSAPGTAELNANAFHETTRSPGASRRVPLATADGRTIWLEFTTSVADLEGSPTVFAIGRDVTEQVTARKEQAAAEAKYRSLVERIPDVIWTCRADGALTFMTPNIENVLGYTVAQMMSEGLEARTEGIHPKDRDHVRAAYLAFAETGASFDVEYRRRHAAGHWVWLRNRSYGTFEVDGVRYGEGMLTEVTDRKRLEDSLRQAQKMEAIGQLSGGVAHDFNNILSVVLANSQFLIDELAANDPRRADVEEIMDAAQRAAGLTRQLLAFSRRQVLEPTVIDVNEAITGVEKMLRRLIGEDIAVAVVRGAGVGRVRVDVGQLEQVLLNLTVNARDAMPTGGSLTIETSTITRATDDGELKAGSYVVLSVIDTGCGMTPETQRRIFEPFFTTKEVGRGTGLGLATSWGIVKQSGGHIAVSSEPGHGTTFYVYLPRVDHVDTVAAPRQAKPSYDGDETILVIEDDDNVRTAITRMLVPRGYHLLVASGATDAIELVRQHRKIDLVLADVVMPGRSGPDIVEDLRPYSAPPVLYMSGYTDHAIFRSDELRLGNFLQKPFTPDALARKVRAVLDAAAAAGSAQRQLVAKPCD